MAGLQVDEENELDTRICAQVHQSRSEVLSSRVMDGSLRLQHSFVQSCLESVF